MLSKGQFEGLAAELAKPGERGFSINVETGEVPKTGFMVSKLGAEKEVPVGPARPIAHYTNENREGLTGRNSHFLGGWKPEDSNTAFLDQSRRIEPTGPDARTSAMDMTLAHRQEAFYDVAKDKVIPSVDWKHWPRDREE